MSWERLKADGHARLNLPRGAAPFADGGFPTPSGKCEFYSQMLADQGLDPLPDFIAPREWRQSPLAASFPLALITPPARNFLNTSFANSPRFLAQEKSPSVLIHPADAATRGHHRRSPGAHLQPSAANSTPAPSSATACDRASSWLPRSGGASFRQTDATATR
jgi:hypothetical protein